MAITNPVDLLLGQRCNALATQAKATPAQPFTDGSYFVTKYMEARLMAYNLGGDARVTKLNECILSKCVALGVAPDVVNSLGMRLGELAQRPKAPVYVARTATTTTRPTLVTTAVRPLTTTVPVITLPQISTSQPVPQVPVAEIAPPEASCPAGTIYDGVNCVPGAPLVQPSTGMQTMAGEIVPVVKVFDGISYMGLSEVQSAMVIALVAGSAQSGFRATGTKDFSGAHWTVFSKTEDPSKPDPALVLSGLVANSGSIIMSMDAEAVYVTSTPYIETAAQVAPVGQTSIYVATDPPTGWQHAPAEAPAATSDGTAPINWGLYLGIGAGVLVLGGVGVYLATRKK